MSLIKNFTHTHINSDDGQSYNFSVVRIYVCVGGGASEDMKNY